MNEEMEFQPMTREEKSSALKKLQAKASDAEPVWVNLKYPENLPWAGMGGLVPVRGTLISVVSEQSGKRKYPSGIVVDFTRMRPFVELPYAKLPIGAVEISKNGEVWVDCRKAVETGVGVPMNNFGERSLN